MRIFAFISPSRMIRLLFLCCTVLSVNISMANSPALKADHPQEYIVQPGDTLWGIADKFLQKPWAWAELWASNPDIENPHQLFPGDIIHFELHNGEPFMRITRETVIKLSPKVRVTDYQSRIPVIPFKLLKPFLSHDLILPEAGLEGTPYVIAGDNEHLSGGQGSVVYVRGIDIEEEQGYGIYRSAQPLIDPETQDTLGMLATYVGRAKMVAAGDPAKLILTDAPQEVLKGDRLLPANESFLKPVYTLHPPSLPIHGYIIAVLGGVTQVGQYQVVVVNQGEVEGLKTGDVLAIQLQGQVVADPIAGKKAVIKLPDEPVGELLVFRTFENASFGIVLTARKALHIGDVVTNP